MDEKDDHVLPQWAKGSGVREGEIRREYTSIVSLEYLGKVENSKLEWTTLLKFGDDMLNDQ